MATIPLSAGLHSWFSCIFLSGRFDGCLSLLNTTFLLPSMSAFPLEVYHVIIGMCFGLLSILSFIRCKTLNTVSVHWPLIQSMLDLNLDPNLNVEIKAPSYDGIVSDLYPRLEVTFRLKFSYSRYTVASDSTNSTHQVGKRI
ncbi:uncharacterized protein BDV14DRAFT_164408 [Aspergillus stella-maris]|uniref:uncharacterized protein n=1 Tax=Aspergillus stella-maris TaxID=1810926 RepID=UPI003CCD7F53